MSTTIFIPGRPIPQQRTGGGKTKKRFDPKRSRDYKQYVAQFLALHRKELKVKEPWAGPCSLILDFKFRRPKSGPNRMAHYHIVKPDADNLTKAIKDAAKGILYVDDCQVCLSSQSKTYVDKDDGVFLTFVKL